MLPQAVESFGLPISMFALRGERDWQDDVVFFYPDYRYHYWYEDRVWQVRYDHRFAGDVGGARPGMSVADLTSVFGEPHYIGEDSLYYDLVDRGFPVRARFFFKDGAVYDIYLYRSDF
jgi:hypothetical protein